MNTYHKNNLIQTALFMLGSSKWLKMQNFFVDKNGYTFNLTPVSKEEWECGTSCCFAGFAPAIIEINEEDEFWADYIDRIFGVSAVTTTWEFLFSSKWINDKNQAAARVLALIKGEVNPDTFSFYDRFYEDLTRDELKENLEKCLTTE